MLFCAPATVPVTCTLNVHEPLAGIVAPDRLAAIEPPVAVIVPPPQEPVTVLEFETTSPAGKVSVKATAVSGIVFTGGLATVKLRLVLPLSGMELAPNIFVIVGGATTMMLAGAA